jgi:hypothetical protein
MPWTVSIKKLPLPKAPGMPEGQPKETAPRHAQTEEAALSHCRELVGQGYTVNVTGPNEIFWDNNAVLGMLTRSK